VKSGQASVTAQRVAAQRLTFDRVAVAYGDAAADDRLARDVAAGTSAATSPMTRYLAARTAFFDRVSVGAIDRGMSQVVIAAAGYDGRALRYAKPGVQWFEVDHPSTQADKRERLDRLAIATDHIAFVAADFATDDVAAGLVRAGHTADQPSLILCEGVAVYLDEIVLRSLLVGLRSVAAPRSRLAISLSVSNGGFVQTLRRNAFRSAVAALGEPARSFFTADSAAELLAASGWQPRPEGSERTRAAGLLLLEPV